MNIPEGISTVPLGHESIGITAEVGGDGPGSFARQPNDAIIAIASIIKRHTLAPADHSALGQRQRAMSANPVTRSRSPTRSTSRSGQTATSSTLGIPLARLGAKRSHTIQITNPRPLALSQPFARRPVAAQRLTDVLPPDASLCSSDQSDAVSTSGLLGNHRHD